MPTLHIETKVGEIAPIVITAGDPKRCQYIANKYLKNAKLVNSVRGMTAFTGEYKDKKITIFPVGMGMPSMGIYAYELYKFYGVEVIIRIGTSGSFNETFKILDTVLLEGSYTESNFAYSYNGDPTHIAYPDEGLTSKITKLAMEKGLNYHLGTVMCTEQFGFYSDNEHVLKRVPEDIHLLGEEMETFALFHIAKSFDKKAAAILTVVDSKYSEEFLTPEERQTSLDSMILLALDTTI